MHIALFAHVRDNKPRMQTISWSELAELLTTFAHRADKDGPLWSPAQYRPGQTRGNDAVVALSALVIDVDEGAAPEDLAVRWDALGLAYVVHSTWHHGRPKPGHPEVVPRWRAVFPLAQPVSAAEWPAVYPRLATYLAGTLWDPACRDAARIHYLPATLDGYAVVALVHDGRMLDSTEAPELPAGWRPGAAPRDAGPAPRTDTGPGHGRPGEDYSARGDHRAVLAGAGWRHVATRGANEHWCRPDKTTGTSATWHTERRVCYVFTSSTGLESGRGYDLFGLRAALEGISHADLARTLVREGFGSPRARRELEQPPPPTDADAPPAEYLDAPPLGAAASLLVSMPAGLPAREDVAKWAGCLAQTAQKADLVADLVAEPLRAAFASGASVAVSGGRVTKPVDVCDTDSRRFRRLLAGEPERKQAEPLRLPIAITRILRRPVDNRATFDLTICSEADPPRCATLARLDGETIGGYAKVRALVLEHCIPLPSLCKAARDAWDDLLAEAFGRVEEDGVDVEESSLLAMRQEIATVLLDSEACDNEPDLRRGQVAQDADGKTLYVWPRALVARLRARMDADKPSRELIVDAAKLLGAALSRRPTLSDGKRPRVWAFPVETLRQHRS